MKRSSVTFPSGFMFALAGLWLSGLACSSSSPSAGGTGGSGGGQTSGSASSASGGQSAPGDSSAKAGSSIASTSTPAAGSSGSGGKTSEGGSSSSTVPPPGGTGGTAGRGGAGGTSKGGQTASGGTSEKGGNSPSGGQSDSGNTSATGGSTDRDAGAGTGSGGRAGSGGTSGGASTASNPGDGGTATTGKSNGCGKAATLKNSPGTTINYNKVASGRQYILRLPDNYDKDHPYNLILSFHWATGSASQVFNCHTEGIDCYTTQSPFFGLMALANNNTIFIAPDGTGSTNSEYWYNKNGEDVTFVDDLLKQVEDDLCIDTAQIRLEGFSMGGAMVNTLVCTHPGVFRAVAAHSAGGQALPSTCQSIPAFVTLGSQENGGQKSTADVFAKFNGCTVETLPTQPAGGHVCTEYKGCKPGFPVMWCPFDGGHGPSPKDSGKSTTWVPQAVWDFFSKN